MRFAPTIPANAALNGTSQEGPIRSAIPTCRDWPGADDAARQHVQGLLVPDANADLHRRAPVDPLPRAGAAPQPDEPQPLQPLRDHVSSDQEEQADHSSPDGAL